jgi:hypothetical protein
MDGAEFKDDAEDGLPPHLHQAMNPQTGLILGRSPEMVKYLLMKAKHRYALEQHEHLIEELRVARCELRRVKDEKEAALDELLRINFGYVQFVGKIPFNADYQPGHKQIYLSSLYCHSSSTRTEIDHC